MFSQRVFNRLLVVIFLFTPFVGKLLDTHMPNADPIADKDFVEYNQLKIRSVENIYNSKRVSKPSDLIFFPLTTVEADLAKNLNSHWIWSENTFNNLESYSPFLFQTKKSARIGEVKVLLQVNSTGRMIGFKILSDVDKGLRERIDYVLRKLPDCKPVPGYDKYGVETFELIIKKS
ncbi:hypothetical protein SYJ56_07725 [Algoriphagus sp. D3-2-R+10]|uniref:hypothetical protein n=1 Tax=Algoriphagus aurantiacus TaxID=3103948 RepID=UPI002B3DB2C2|nr:hypothetical protein [Algoriphagus sp. D3-2-R+10]MEB2775192.1 hypothetical protein [Algoriphagus sp. D3-2-R+10]